MKDLVYNIDNCEILIKEDDKKFWINVSDICKLYNRARSTIVERIKKCCNEVELMCRKFQQEKDNGKTHLMLVESCKRVRS